MQGTNELLALQMDALHKCVPTAILGIFGASMVLYTFRDAAPAAGLALWMVCIVIIATTHVSATFFRSRNKPANWTDRSWATMARFVYASAGLCWGLGSGWMVGYGSEHQILVVMCVMMGAVTATFPIVVYPAAYNLFQAGALVPFAIGLSMSPMEYGLLLAGGCILLVIFGTFIGYSMGNQIILGMKHSIENKQMAIWLEERGAALEVVNRELEVQSQTDPLTGIANRRRLMSFARAAGPDCAMLIVDIDDFKSYNDSFGHVEGDSCLVAVANALNARTRPDLDIVARLGGEEFAVVMNETTREFAIAMAEQMRADIESLFQTQPGAIRRPISVSIGLGYRDAKRSHSLDQLMDTADAAVYAAKAAGRNQVCFGAEEQAQRVA